MKTTKPNENVRPVPGYLERDVMQLHFPRKEEKKPAPADEGRTTVTVSIKESVKDGQPC